MSLLSKTDENTQGDPAGRLAPAATHTDPAAQLVQLRKAKELRPFDDHDRGGGHVYAHLDHRGRNQDARRPAGGISPVCS